MLLESLAANSSLTVNDLPSYTAKNIELCYFAAQIECLHNLTMYMTQAELQAFIVGEDTANLAIKDFHDLYKHKVEVSRILTQITQTNHSELMSEVNRLLDKNPFGR